jgi:Flp pilus assembly pilin Flp
MKAFIVACIAAAVIAIGAVAVLNGIQKPVETAFTTSGVRI